MAYKSLIDYYGGGMVKPSQGYALGGMVSSFGIKSEAESERRALREKMKKDAREREKGGWKSFVGGLIGTGLGSLVGMPQVGAAIGSGLGQYSQEKGYSPVDVSGGKYALDIKEEIGKGQEEYKEGGLERIGMSGLMGYMGGGEGGMYQSILGAPKKLAAKVAEKAATKAATTAATKTAVGAVAPTAAGAAMPASIGPAPELFSRGLTGSGTGETMAQGLQDWALPEFKEQMADSTLLGGGSGYSGFKLDPSSVLGESGLAQSLQLPSTSGGFGMGDPYAGFAPSVGQLDIPNIPLFSPSQEGLPSAGQASMARAGGVGDEGSWLGSTFLRGLFGGGGFGYNKPRGYQGGGPVGDYATSTDPLDALRQMGMDKEANDPRIGDYADDLPKFTMGYKQELGDVTAGARTGLLNIGKEGRLTGARTGFAGGGGWMNPEARQEVQRQFGSQKRGVVEGYQADLLSALDRIQSEAGITFGERSGTSMPIYDPAPTNEAGWMPPTGAAHGQIYTYGGENWYYSDNNWLSEDEYHDRDQGEGE